MPKSGAKTHYIHQREDLKNWEPDLNKKTVILALLPRNCIPISTQPLEVVYAEFKKRKERSFRILRRVGWHKYKNRDKKTTKNITNNHQGN